MEHLFFNCHGEATLVLQALAGLGSLGGLSGLLGVLKAALPTPSTTCSHSHGEEPV